MVPMRQELARSKDMCNKERMARLSAQQEVTQLKEQLGRLEQSHDHLEREVKTIPTLNESNEILKSELTQIRRRYKEEKMQFTRQIKSMEGRARNVDAIKGEVRGLALKLLEISSNGPNTSNSYNGTDPSGNSNYQYSNATTISNNSGIISNTINRNYDPYVSASLSTERLNSKLSYNEDYDSADEVDDDTFDDNNTYNGSLSDNELDDQLDLLDDSQITALSTDSPARSIRGMQANTNPNNTHTSTNTLRNSNSSKEVKKKKVKKVVSNKQVQQSYGNGNNSGNGSNGYTMNPSSSVGSLPRI